MKKIKICGLKRSEDVDYVNTYQPDYVGFVFAGKKRKITYDQAKELKKRSFIFDSSCRCFCK